MNIIDSTNNKMAMVNLDIALDIFKDLLDENRISKTDRDINWARQCCTYSRCVHLNVWRDNTPIEIVRNEITPLLTKAEEGLCELEEKYLGKEKYKSEIEYYKTNVCLRKQNLAENFSNENPSDFPPDAVDPHMRTRFDSIRQRRNGSNTVKHTK